MKQGELIMPQQVMIECKLTPTGASTTTLNPFDEQDYLINRPIIGIQAYSASDIPNSPIGGKLPVIPDALFKKAFMNINRSGQGPIKAGVWFKNIPLVALRHIWNNTVNLAGNLDMFRCDPMTIQWRDTNVSFPTPATQDESYSVPFLITFLLPEQDPNEYRMAFLKGQARRLHGLYQEF